MTLTLDFQGQIFKWLYIGMWGLIDIELKGYEQIGCYTYYVAFSYDLDLGFSRWENAVSQEWEGRLT